MAKLPPKLTVLSIDGVPFDLLRRMIEQGDMPNIATLANEAGMRQMRSVQPTVSCVAWTSYMTGKNPGKHGIYGFIDRHQDRYDITLPNASAMTSQNIWEILSSAGRRVFGMNVPVTYPPRQVNGILIGGFLSPTPEKAAYPNSVGQYLKSIGYHIDSDAALGRSDKHALLDDLKVTLDKRMEAMFHFLDSENWDFFHTHIMGSDRINHFLLAQMENNNQQFAPAFFEYYRRIDEYIGKLLDRIGSDAPLMIFSDHGFCRIKYEVQLSRYLVQAGWTALAESVQHPLSIDPSKSRAYCLIPGRIYVNLRGREPGGIVPIEQYQKTREALSEELLKLRDPETGEAVIRRVVTREQIYWPDGEAGLCQMTPREVAQASGTFGKAADLIAIPHDGYDLKLGLNQENVFASTALEGMHTYDDAFMISRGVELPQRDLEIMMLARPILQQLGVEPPPDMDGHGSAITPME